MSEEKKTEQEVVDIVIRHETLVEALAYAQLEYSPLEKTNKVDFTTDKGRRINYNYADLASMRAATDPHLNKHGLAVTDRTEKREGNREFLISQLRHAFSDAYDETEIEITVSSEDMKDMAANMTYAKRYNYGNLTGRVAEEDQDAKDVDRHSEKQRSSQGEGKSQPPPDKNKVAFFQLLTEKEVFENDDARHVWQGKAIPGKPSTTQWNSKQFIIAKDLISWRLVAGIQSDGLLEYITTKAKSTKGLQKQFLALMGVSKLTDIKDVSRWNVGMTAAKLSISHKLEIALDMGKVLMRVDGVVFDTFLETVGVDRMIKMDSEQVIGWEVSFRSAVNQYNTENTDAKVDVEKLIAGDEDKV